MMVKTFGRGLRFAFVLTLLPVTAISLWSKNGPGGSGDTQESAGITISVYNDAEVPVDVLSKAEEQARQVFWRAGIEVAWLNCRVPAVSEEASQACREAVYPKHLHLRIVRKSSGLKGEAMGVSFQADDGSGCSADLFYEPMKELHKSDGTDVASLLGHVAAHEIGHLLLGTNSHAASGIMRARWTAEELADRKIAALVFSDQEALRIRARLAKANARLNRRTPDGSPEEFRAYPGLRSGPVSMSYATLEGLYHWAVAAGRRDGAGWKTVV